MQSVTNTQWDVVLADLLDNWFDQSTHLLEATNFEKSAKSNLFFRNVTN